jgi:hypothetical protein
MPWSYRRSKKLGPIRVNLSKSGIGYSVGNKYLRTGKTAKGRSYTSSSPLRGLRYQQTNQAPASRGSQLVAASIQLVFALGLLLFALFIIGALVVGLGKSTSLVPDSPTAITTPIPTAAPLSTYMEINMQDLYSRPNDFIGQRVHIVGTFYSWAQRGPTSVGPAYFSILVPATGWPNGRDLDITYPADIPSSWGRGVRTEIYGIVDVQKLGGTVVSYRPVIRADVLR